MSECNLQAVGTYQLPSGLMIEMSASQPDRRGGQTLLLTLPGGRESRPAVTPGVRWFVDSH